MSAHDRERPRLLVIEKKRAAARTRSALRRRRAKAGRVVVFVELDDVNAAERFGLHGETDRQDLQEALQAFVDSEINVTRDGTGLSEPLQCLAEFTASIRKTDHAAPERNKRHSIAGR
jgi:hypothetical protein